MNLENMTLGQIRALCGSLPPQAAQPAPCSDGPYRVGEAYLFRTVTMAWTGRIRAVYPNELVLDDAAWIADTGRYHAATCAQNLGEIEPAGDGVVIGRGTIVDARPWTTALPKAVK